MLKKNFLKEKNVKHFWKFCQTYFTSKDVCNNEPNNESWQKMTKF